MPSTPNVGPKGYRTLIGADVIVLPRPDDWFTRGRFVLIQFMIDVPDQLRYGLTHYRFYLS